MATTLPSDVSLTTSSVLDRRSGSTLRTACEALGVNVVIDLFDYPDDEAGNRRVRALLEQQMHDA